MNPARRSYPLYGPPGSGAEFCGRSHQRRKPQGETARKRHEYSHALVPLAWLVDPRGRTVAVFTCSDDFAVYDEKSTLDCGDILPGWLGRLEGAFAKLDQRKPS